MDLINALLGFIVLTSPLWLILIVLILGVWAAFRIRKRFDSRGAKLAAALGVFVLAFLVLFGDELVGRAYLNYLCATKAGVEVYHTVELPVEYWNANGRPNFFNEHGNLDRNLWLERLDESGGENESYSGVFFIDRSASWVRERESQKVLAGIINFRYWGGWVRRNFSLHNTADSCAFVHDRDFSRSLYGRIFSPPTR